MDVINRYSLFIGSARGTITYTNLDPDTKLQYEFAEEPSEISAMIWNKENEILVGFKNGIVANYDTCIKKYQMSINHFKDDGSVVGLGILDEKILVTSSKGKISILDSENKFTTLETLSSDNETLDASCQKISKPIIATGGENNDLKLWNIETKQCVFKAKSMGHDFLNLPIKTSVRGITFLPGEENLCCCATKEGFVLLYDERAQRRPICKYLEKKASFTSITSAYRERNILAGTTKGYIQYIDMKTGKLLKTFTGICGSVTCLECDPVEPILFTTSLDRYLRIINLETKNLIHKQYLKQNLKKLLLKPILKDEKNDNPSVVSEVDEEYEEIFKNMEEIVENPVKRKNKQLKNHRPKKIKIAN